MSADIKGVTSIRAAAPDCVWAIANRTIYHFNGNKWREQWTAPTELFGLAVADKNNAWVLGADGSVYAYKNSRWESEHVAESLWVIATAGAGLVFGLAEAGRIYRHRGGRWELVADLGQIFHIEVEGYDSFDPMDLLVVDESHLWCAGNSSYDVSGEEEIYNFVYFNNGFKWERQLDDLAKAAVGAGDYDAPDDAGGAIDSLYGTSPDYTVAMGGVGDSTCMYVRRHSEWNLLRSPDYPYRPVDAVLSGGFGMLQTYWPRFILNENNSWGIGSEPESTAQSVFFYDGTEWHRQYRIPELEGMDGIGAHRQMNSIFALDEDHVWMAGDGIFSFSR
ncbi:MAG: hypothetical protein V1748_00875 [Actinomycetota bacterium]